MNVDVIAYMHTDFSEKFGIPRQSGLVPKLLGKIVFEPEYRSVDALRGLEGYSHLWILWEFSQVTEGRDESRDWTPLIRPPRLGGNKRVGVFASRSPYRPNPIGLSVVKIKSIELNTPDGPVITVSGVDMLDGTPIIDIKPYLPHVDAHPEAVGGFSGEAKEHCLKVELPEDVRRDFPADKLEALFGVLSQDPRPGYHHDDRMYGISFAGYNVRFNVDEGRQLLTVRDINKEMLNH